MVDAFDAHVVWQHADPADRVVFAGFVFAGDTEECWIWTGGLESNAGYGRWRPAGRNVVSAHRWSHDAHHGPTELPVVRHECDVRCCVNPHHLVAGTQADNIRDTVDRGGWRSTALPIWPDRSYRLRELARVGDRATINTIVARAEQLSLFTLRV